MQNKRLSKEENQPTITTLLPNCTNKGDIDQALLSASAKSVKADIPGVNVSSTTADHTINKHTEPHDKEFIEVESSKKRKRRNCSSSSPKINPNKKVNMDDPAASNNDEHIIASPPESHTPLVPIPEVTLSQELLELERRLKQEHDS